TPQVGQKHGSRFAEVVLAAADSFEAILASYQRGKRLPSLEKLRGLIRGLLVEAAPVVVETPAPQAPVLVPAIAEVPATFAWTEYEQLMISEAVHRGESVYNVALRIDPDSLMRAAAFQLIRNVLHGCGTLIALRPEDNLAAATVEVVEAAVASVQPEEAIKKRCRIPSIVSDVRVERATSAHTPEHELLGELLEAQAAHVVANTAESGDAADAAKSA